MKTYNIRQQENNTYCVPSVLQAIFNKYDIDFSQEEISNALTFTEKGLSVKDDKMSNFMDIMGFEYNFYHWDKTPFNEPDSLLKYNEEKDIFLGWNKHVVLNIGFKDPLVFYLDPEDKIPHNRIIGLSNLLTKMRETQDGFFGLLERL